MGGLDESCDPDRRRRDTVEGEAAVRPKPIMQIGDCLVIWHIMRSYAANSIDDFIVCCGYRGDVIKKYFFNYAR